jgi:hypothetical protein
MQEKGHIIAKLQQPSMNEQTLSKIGWGLRHKLEISRKE